MKYYFNISGTFSSILGAILLMLFSSAIAIPAVAQKAPEGTGILWRNLEVRPLNCTFSPDGRQLACGSWGRGPAENITIVDAKSGNLVRSFGKKEFGNRQIELMAWSNDGTKLAAVTNYMPQSESGLRGVVYEVSSGKIIRPLDLKGASRLADVAFSENGERVAAVAIPDVYHWSLTGKDSADVTTLKMKNYGGESVKFLPGAEQLVTGRKNAYIWDATTGKKLITLHKQVPKVKSGNFAAFSFSPDGKWIVGMTFDLKGKIWKRETGKQQAVLNLAQGRELTLREQGDPSLNFVDSGTLAVYAPALGKVHLMKIPSGREVFAFDALKSTATQPQMDWHGDRFVYGSLQRSPLALHLLCRGTVQCGKEEGLTPEKLGEVLPAAAAGLKRAAIRSRWGKKGPNAQARYGGMKRGLEIEVNIMSKAEIAKLHKMWESRLKQKEMFKKTYRGYTMYGGGDEKGRGMVLLLESATVMMEGNVAMEQMMSTFDTLPLGKIQELAASNQ